MKKIIGILLGIALFFGSLWGGAYLLDSVLYGWFAFAGVISTLCLMIVGIVTFGTAIDS